MHLYVPRCGPGSWKSLQHFQIRVHSLQLHEQRNSCLQATIRQALAFLRMFSSPTWSEWLRSAQLIYCDLRPFHGSLFPAASVISSVMKRALGISFLSSVQLSPTVTDFNKSVIFKDRERSRDGLCPCFTLTLWNNNHNFAVFLAQIFFFSWVYCFHDMLTLKWDQQQQQQQLTIPRLWLSLHTNNSLFGWKCCFFLYRCETFIIAFSSWLPSSCQRPEQSQVIHYYVLYSRILLCNYSVSCCNAAAEAAGTLLYSPAWLPIAWHLFFGLSSWNANDEGLFAYLFIFLQFPPTRVSECDEAVNSTYAWCTPTLSASVKQPCRC